MTPRTDRGGADRERPPLTARDLSRATLARQGLLAPVAAEPAEAVTRVGSLQAQHPEWPPVALASRAADPATADLAGALERRTVVRSSLMRITIHVVASDDLWPMFTVMQPLRLAQWRLLLKADPLTSPLGKRMLASHDVAIAALRERPHTSLELDRLMAAQVGPAATATSRARWQEPETHVVVRAAWRHFAALVPLVHVPWDGEGYGRSRYALAADWLGAQPPSLDEPEARIHVARRYLAAFGPATIDDLVAYVGRGKGGIGPWREAVAALAEETITLMGDDGRTYLDLADAPRPAADTSAPPRLLARWDSVLLSHGPKARQRIIADDDRPRVFSRNADVLPTFLVDGMVAGTWELTRDGGVAIELRPFRRLTRQVRDDLVSEAERVLGLLAPEADRRVRVAA
jgi:hypothetical protein